MIWLDVAAWLLALPPVLWLADLATVLLIAVCWPDKVGQL